MLYNFITPYAIEGQSNCYFCNIIIGSILQKYFGTIIIEISHACFINDTDKTFIAN